MSFVKEYILNCCGFLAVSVGLLSALSVILGPLWLGQLFNWTSSSVIKAYLAEMLLFIAVLTYGGKND